MMSVPSCAAAAPALPLPGDGCDSAPTPALSPAPSLNSSSFGKGPAEGAPSTRRRRASKRPAPSAHRARAATPPPAALLTVASLLSAPTAAATAACAATSANCKGEGETLLEALPEALLPMLLENTLPRDTTALPVAVATVGSSDGEDAVDDAGLALERAECEAEVDAGGTELRVGLPEDELVAAPEDEPVGAQEDVPLAVPVTEIEDSEIVGGLQVPLRKLVAAEDGAWLSAPALDAVLAGLLLTVSSADAVPLKLVGTAEAELVTVAAPDTLLLSAVASVPEGVRKALDASEVVRLGLLV